MDELAPLGRVYQAGTLSGNPLATAVGLAVLDALDDGAYAVLEQRATALTDGLHDALRAAGVAAVAPRAFTLCGLFFAAVPVRDYDDAKAADLARHARFFHGMLDRGVYFAPSAFEAIFPSLAHTDADIAHTLEAAGEVAAGLAD
jgi:glutamate-1-semialdehyde 2,1-aminomutase